MSHHTTALPQIKTPTTTGVTQATLIHIQETKHQETQTLT